jgi:hypothetical protein
MSLKETGFSRRNLIIYEIFCTGNFFSKAAGSCLPNRSTQVIFAKIPQKEALSLVAV